MTLIPKPDTDITKKKITAQFFDENRCKNSQQNIIKPNLTHKQDHTPQPSWIHVKFTSVVQHMQINQCDILHKQNNRQNHIITSIDAEKAFHKIQHLFMIKTNQSRYTGNISQYNKSYL